MHVLAHHVVYHKYVVLCLSFLMILYIDKIDLSIYRLQHTFTKYLGFKHWDQGFYRADKEGTSLFWSEAESLPQRFH